MNNPIGCFNLVIEMFFKSSLTLRQSPVIIFPLISIVLMLISVEVDVEHGKVSLVFTLPQKKGVGNFGWTYFGTLLLYFFLQFYVQFNSGYNLCKNDELSFYFFSHPVSVFGLLSDFVISFAWASRHKLMGMSSKQIYQQLAQRRSLMWWCSGLADVFLVPHLFVFSSCEPHPGLCLKKAGG